MSYQVLARKWRPHTFEEMVGQEHVLQALINALDNDRLHHAYLFTGTRGVGKTTVARILAKSLNCEQKVSSKPCGVCSACTEIDEGRFVDLIEVDAASRTRVEDTRELLENVQYAPTRGRFKVYLIDEVHMLSDHSFNALLKTLEEPPPHVKFLLATTDPQKLPVTVLSRCLQFNLKHLPVKLIYDHLLNVTAKEQVETEAAGIHEIARAADGSMRDALSLLDQAIAHGGGKVSEKEVRDMLGTIEMVHVVTLLQALIAADGKQLMDQIAVLAEFGPDYNGVLAELVSLLHRVALAQVVPSAIDESYGDADAIRELAGKARAEDIQLFYQIAINGRRDMPMAADARSGFEMVLLRMLAFQPDNSVRARAKAPAQSVAPAVASAQADSAQPTQAPVAEQAGQPAEVREPAPVAVPATGDWEQVVDAMGLKAAAGMLASNCAFVKKENGTVYLQLQQRHEQIAGDSARQRLESALQQYYGEEVKIRIEVVADDVDSPAARQQQRSEVRHRQAVNTMEQDSMVQGLKETFGAEINPDMVQALDEQG